MFIIDGCYSGGSAIKNCREVLAANAIEQVTANHVGKKGLRSFTFALCEVLRSLERPRSVAQVHAKLIEDWQDASKDLHIQTTPIHKADQITRERSIVFKPIRQSVPSRQIAAVNPTKVLITAKISDSVPTNLGDWDRWLRSKIPADIEDVTVEGLWDKGSSLLLLRLPISAWDMIRDDPAYSFVDYVGSGNLIL